MDERENALVAVRERFWRRREAETTRFDRRGLAYKAAAVSIVIVAETMMLGMAFYAGMVWKGRALRAEAVAAEKTVEAERSADARVLLHRAVLESESTALR